MSENTSASAPESSRIRCRLLYIASIVCVAACVALMGMWARSYHTSDNARGRLSSSRVFAVRSVLGRVIASEFEQPPDTLWHAMTLSLPIAEGMQFPDPHLEPCCLSTLGFQLHISQSLSVVVVPYWMITLVTGTLALLFQMRWPWRFNLRGLFAMTTLLAIVLGTSAWLDRGWIGR